jgi:tripartite-type tricarboxylate transporter receptor subunit TctC
VNWDPLRDLAPITLAISSPNVLVVHPSLPVKSVKELIALAKASAASSITPRAAAAPRRTFAAELFKYMAKVQITRINYKGSVRR